MWDPTSHRLLIRSRILLFQSAGPVWDPTVVPDGLAEYINISIRGSRVGPDIRGLDYLFIQNISIRGSRVGPDVIISLPPLSNLFQSAGPVWDPTQLRKSILRYLHISIRGSRVGPDGVFVVVANLIDISIRGSRVGPDTCARSARSRA